MDTVLPNPAKAGLEIPATVGRIWVELGQGFTKHNLSFIRPLLMDEAFEGTGGGLTPCIWGRFVSTFR